ncbi:hypothetical protein [Oceanobacillus rekensis]|uniref:hypothetical protein n=1 Tax=Oceanobacillus rekensis TaxID=937927 RepID=UPI000B4534CA|nr:hypothetical protein [Oceanobacillus rekensis]
MSLLEEKLHLPDLQFMSLCKEKYGLNRGIYNVIDSWFYDQGIINITERRKQITNFLDFNVDCMENGKLKFGHKKLNLYLKEYMEKNEVA